MNYCSEMSLEKVDLLNSNIAPDHLSISKCRGLSPDQEYESLCALVWESLLRKTEVQRSSGQDASAFWFG